jgi:hypothetical protein
MIINQTPRFTKPLGIALLTSSLILALAFPLGALAEAEGKLPEIKLTNRFNRGVQRITGVTALSGSIGSTVIEKALKKELALQKNGDLDVHLKPFSATDLVHGNLKRLKIEGKNLLIKNTLPIETLLIKSDPDTPIYLSDTKKPVLLRPIQLQMKATLTEADLNQLLKSDYGQKKLSGVKVPLPPFDNAQQLDVLSPSVTLSNGQLSAAFAVNITGAKPENAVPVNLSANLAPKANRIQLADLKLNIDGVEDTEAIADFVEQYFGELVNLEQIKIDRHRLKVSIERCDIKNNKVQLQAVITINPTDKALQKLLAKE